MRKNIFFLLVILWGATSTFYGKSKDFTFINKTLQTVTIEWSNTSKVAAVVGVGGIFSDGITLQPGERKSVNIKGGPCINRIRLGVGVLRTGLFGGLFQPKEDFWGEWIDGYIWKRFVPKCSGVAEIIKKNKKFKIRWLK